MGLRGYVCRLLRTGAAAEPVRAEDDDRDRLRSAEVELLYRQAVEIARLAALRAGRPAGE